MPKARSQQATIAASTPNAVHGLGSPEPPWRLGRPLTWRVTWAMACMSRVDVPTSSAVT